MSEAGKQVLKVGNGLKFTLTIEGNNLGDIVDLFDLSRIHQQPAKTFTPETPESLMEEPEPKAPAKEPEQEPQPKAVSAEPKEPDPKVTMETLKHKAIEVSERLGTKKVVGEAIKAHFNCRMPDLKPEQFEEALQILEDLKNA